MRNFRIMAVASLAALALLAGCQQKTPGTSKAAVGAAEAANCTAQAQAPWGIAAGQVYQISAAASGPDCAKSVITLVVRGQDDLPLFVTALAAHDGNLAFADVKDSADMQQRLQDWIAPAQAGFSTSADLPPWPQGAQGPVSPPAQALLSGFPFYPEAEAFGQRTNYEALRAAKAPVFCYVQGSESYACLAAQDGDVFTIGLQVFPG